MLSVLIYLCFLEVDLGPFLLLEKHIPFRIVAVLHLMQLHLFVE